MFDYIDNPESDEYAELREHLSECEACQGELDECKKMLASVSGSAPEPPAGMKSRVMLAVAADKRANRMGRIRRVSAVAAAFVLFVGVGVAMRLFGGGRNFDSEDAMGGDYDAPNAGGEFEGEGVTDGKDEYNGAVGGTSNAENQDGTGSQTGSASTDDMTPENPSDVAEFSYANDYEYYADDAGAMTDGFLNTEPSVVSGVGDALGLAMLECTVKYDATKAYYDANADAWKVVFYTEGVDGGCQTVYLGGNGITLLIVYGE